MTNKILVLPLILIMSASMSCAGKREPGRAKVPEGAHGTPVGTSDDELTPQRAASRALVADGEKAFAQGRYDLAGDLFQQAVTVDPTHGEAYYHLALVKIRTGEYGEAEGLIEKADQLLGQNPEWTLKLEDLKREFHRNKPRE